VDDVLALSGHPLGAACGPLPPMVTDYAREVPSYGDGWSGPRPASPTVLVGGHPVDALPDWALGPQDRVLFAGSLGHLEDATALLAVLRAGAALVLLPDPPSVEVARVAADERATAAWRVTSGAVRSLA
jgi:hypothetical protein